MALLATLLAPVRTSRLRRQVRLGRIAVWAGVGLCLVVSLLHLRPFVPAGADLADAGQRAYAANLWGQVQVGLAMIGCFLPWLTYALLWQGSARGSGVLAAVAGAGTVLATGLTVATVGNYVALPRAVTGVVQRVEGRTLRLDAGAAAYYLALSDSQMVAAAPWLKPGRSVLLWVSPRGQVGDLEPADPSRGEG